MILSKGNKLIFLFLIVLTAFLFALSFILPRTNLDRNRSVAEAAAVLTFPTDHDDHPNYAAEWWYTNMLVTTVNPSGGGVKEQAFVLSFSRILGTAGLLSSQYDNSNKSFSESTDEDGSLIVSLISNSRMRVQYSKGSTTATLEEQPTGSDRKRVYKLFGNAPHIGNFNLTLKERTVVAQGFNQPLLWGGNTGNCQGQISVFSKNDTYYYSIPDLDITGTITGQDGVVRTVVIGKAWIDHQWFNSVPPTTWRGHYWTNFHYTDTGNLYDPGPHQALGFVTQFYDTGSKYTYWVKRNKNGTNECGTTGAVIVHEYGNSGYPSAWSINNGYINVLGAAFSDNQIFQTPVGPRFIETASYYSGGGINGLGFFETHINDTLIVTVTPTPVPTTTSVPIPTSSSTPTPTAGLSCNQQCAETCASRGQCGGFCSRDRCFCSSCTGF